MGGFVSVSALRKASLIAAGAAALASYQASGAEDAKSQAEGIIFERQQIMEQLGKDSDTLGRIVAGQLPASGLAEVTKSIAQGAHDSVEAFKQQVPGGRTKAEAWTNNADFTARMTKFAAGADAMAKAGEKNDVTAVVGLMIEALPCKECHDVYRERKKPAA
jgi:cytochrome c556